MGKTRVVLLIEKVIETEEEQLVIGELVDRLLALGGTVIDRREEAAGEGKEGAPPVPGLGVNPSGWTFRDFESLWYVLSPGAKKVLTEIARRPSGYPDEELAVAVGMKTVQEVGGSLASVGRRLAQFPGRDPVYRKQGGMGGSYTLAPEVAGFIQVLANYDASHPEQQDEAFPPVPEAGK